MNEREARVLIAKNSRFVVLGVVAVLWAIILSIQEIAVVRC